MTAPVSAQLVNGKFQVCAPEEQGIPSGCIKDFIRAIEAQDIEMHSFYLLRHGKQIAKCITPPFTEDTTPHRIYSAGKGIIALAVLFLVQEGRITLDSKLVDIFREDLPDAVSEDMRNMTVYHLLTMSNGHMRSAFYEMRQSENWIKTFFMLPLKPGCKPGQLFDYNNCAPHMATAMVRVLTGENMCDYLQERLFIPLGIHDLCEMAPGQPDLEPTTQCMTPLDFAKLTQFLLQRGMWEGRQLICADLVDQIGLRHFPTIDDPTLANSPSKKNGFGLFSRMSSFGGYRLTGGYGQEAIIIPELDISCCWLCNENKGTCEMMLDLFHKFILQHTYARPLQQDPDSLEELYAVLESYTVAPRGNVSTSLESQLNGTHYKIVENDADIKMVTIWFADEKVLLDVNRNGRMVSVQCGLSGKWERNDDFPLIPTDDSLNPKIKGYEPDRILGYSCDQPWLLSAAWEQDNVLAVYMRRPDLQSTVRHWFRFNGSDIEIRIHSYFLPGENPQKPDTLLSGNAC